MKWTVNILAVGWVGCTPGSWPGDKNASDSASSSGDSGDSGDSGELPDLEMGPRGLLVAQSWERANAPLGEGAGHYRIIVLQASMGRLLPDVRAANPDARILAYQKVGGMRADGVDTPSTGVQIHEAEEGHEDWILHDAEGNRLWYCDYPEVMAADIGNPGYQQRWLDNVTTRMLRDGFDGVMMDDVNTFPGHCLGSRGTPIAEYAEDVDYGDAVVEFMAAVGPSLRASGLLVAPNIAMNPWDETMRSQALAMLPHSTHIDREYWMRWDDSPNFTGDMWLSTLTLYEEAEALGVGFLGLTYGPGEEGVVEGQRYGRASFLLAWDGVADSAWGYLDEAVEPWSSEWAGDPGLPEGPRTASGVGWTRDYSRATVVVNPDEAVDQTFSLEGPHVGEDGATIDAITLAAGHGRIVWKAE